MKKLELTATSVDHAKLLAHKQGITVVFDATRLWAKAKRPLLAKDLQSFASNIMTRHGMFEYESAGIIIALKPATYKRRVYPYRLENCIRKGRIKIKKEIHIKRKSDDVTIGVAYSKNEAKTVAKRLIKAEKEDLYALSFYVSQEPEFTLRYDYADSTQLGEYVIFYTDSEDVRLNSRKHAIIRQDNS